MAVLDFISFINQNTPLSVTEKQEMLDDFCSFFNYTENGNGLSKAAFSNKKIQDFILSCVNQERKRQAELASTFTELQLN